MAKTLLHLAAAVALIAPAWSTAISRDPSRLAARGALANPQCTGQACVLADLSGSSGHPYTSPKPPKDLSYEGYCCIIQHNPSASARLYSQNPGLQAQCQSSKRSVSGNKYAGMIEDILGPLEERAGCEPNILIFARGTADSGPIGSNVGPAVLQALNQKAPGKWGVRGVEYTSGDFGNECVGLPGGDIAKSILEQTAAECPLSKIIMSGYSQGAMVARNGVAYSSAASHANLKGVVTFGDPFKGSPIKGFGGSIVVYCAAADRVCDGRKIITGAHSSYVGADTDDAASRMIQLVK